MPHQMKSQGLGTHRGEEMAECEYREAGLSSAKDGLDGTPSSVKTRTISHPFMAIESSI